MTPREMVDELIDLGNLTRWEQNFIERIGDDLDRGVELSEDQQAKLEQIYEERT